MSDPIEAAASAPSFDAARFREVLGHFPTGVTVVTGMAATGEPVGLAVGSFTSASLDPPLVAICPAKSSNSWPVIESAGAFCVNVLADDQEAVCRVFAGKGADKFEGLAWHAAGSGAPIIGGVLAWIDCDIEAVHEAGDHWIVLGRVRDLDATGSGQPLVFYRGGFGRFAP